MACQEPAQAASEPQLQRKAGVDCEPGEPLKRLYLPVARILAGAAPNSGCRTCVGLDQNLENSPHRNRFDLLGRSIDR